MAPLSSENRTIGKSETERECLLGSFPQAIFACDNLNIAITNAIMLNFCFLHNVKFAIFTCDCENLAILTWYCLNLAIYTCVDYIKLQFLLVIILSLRFEVAV